MPSRWTLTKFVLSPLNVPVIPLSFMRTPDIVWSIETMSLPTAGSESTMSSGNTSPTDWLVSASSVSAAAITSTACATPATSSAKFNRRRCVVPSVTSA